MAYIVMACIVMAKIVMACIAMAYMRAPVVAVDRVDPKPARRAQQHEDRARHLQHGQRERKAVRVGLEGHELTIDDSTCDGPFD